MDAAGVTLADPPGSVPDEATMQAAVCRAYGEPLTLERRPLPTPGAGEVLLRVDAVGLCATDLKTISGALAPGTTLPLIPGHEVAGTVVRDGSADDPEGDLLGRRVAVYLYESCGHCARCLEDRPTLCSAATRIGIERDGGLAGYMVAARANLLPYGDAIDATAAAVAMDAVTSPWGALHGRARIQPGETLVVVGCGGLGLNAIQIARAAGARVAAVDLAPAHRELALANGAEIAVDPDEAESGAIHAWAPGGADLALETSGRRAGFQTAAASLRAGGRVVCNGYQPGVEYGMDSARLVLEEITILGSRVGTLDDARDALAAVESGAVVPQIMRTAPLSDINEALDALAAGRVDGRIVITPHAERRSEP
jgi:D-arabinose 1-dehydrogenase-like Zn-dependent alcohol dehydrogenase